MKSGRFKCFKNWREPIQNLAQELQTFFFAGQNLMGAHSDGLPEPQKSGGFSEDVIRRVACKIVGGSDQSPVKSAKAMLDVRRLTSMAKWNGPRTSPPPIQVGMFTQTDGVFLLYTCTVLTLTPLQKQDAEQDRPSKSPEQLRHAWAKLLSSKKPSSDGSLKVEKVTVIEKVVINEANRRRVETKFASSVSANPRPQAQQAVINPAMVDAIDSAQHANERLIELLRVIPRKYLVYIYVDPDFIEKQLCDSVCTYVFMYVWHVCTYVCMYV